MNSFVALDVETANPDYSSICAIGLCRFDSGLVVDEWHRLIDPGEPFEARNIAIHGIRPEHVIGQPSYSELAEDLDRFVRGSMVVHHGHFDRNAIKQTSQRWALPAPVWDFLDSAQAARQAWPQLVRGGYGLSDLCKEIGHELEHHHNALDDARAAGAVYLAAAERLGEDTVPALARRIDDAAVDQGALWPNFDQFLLGEVVVFSREASLPSLRPDLASTLKWYGYKVQKNLSKSATILVLGHDEWHRSLPSQQRQNAEQRVGAGQRLQIMSETDFLSMIENS